MADILQLESGVDHVRGGDSAEMPIRFSTARRRSRTTGLERIRRDAGGGSYEAPILLEAMI